MSLPDHPRRRYSACRENYYCIPTRSATTRMSGSSRLCAHQRFLFDRRCLTWWVLGSPVGSPALVVGLGRIAWMRRLDGSGPVRSSSWRPVVCGELHACSAGFGRASWFVRAARESISTPVLPQAEHVRLCGVAGTSRVPSSIRTRLDKVHHARVPRSAVGAVRRMLLRAPTPNAASAAPSMNAQSPRPRSICLPTDCVHSEAPSIRRVRQRSSTAGPPRKPVPRSTTCVGGRRRGSPTRALERLVRVNLIAGAPRRCRRMPA